MKRITQRQRVALAVALVACVLTLCAVAHAGPLHLDRWASLLGQHTGGSFGGSSWGSGGGARSGGGTSSGGGGSTSDSIIGAIFELIITLILELLARVFLYCLTTYPFPTIATLAIGALFWASRWRQDLADQWMVPKAATRGPEFVAEDEAVFKRLALVMKLSGAAGFALSGALLLGGLAAAVVWSTRSALPACGAILVALLGALVGFSAYQTREASKSITRVVETQGSDIEHVAEAVGLMLPAFKGLALLLGVASAVLGVLVVAVFAVGASR